jgi:hypothetical protein
MLWTFGTLATLLKCINHCYHVTDTLVFISWELFNIHCQIQRKGDFDLGGDLSTKKHNLKISNIKRWGKTAGKTQPRMN